MVPVLALAAVQTVTADDILVATVILGLFAAFALGAWAWWQPRTRRGRLRWAIALALVFVPVVLLSALGGAIVAVLLLLLAIGWGGLRLVVRQVKQDPATWPQMILPGVISAGLLTLFIWLAVTLLPHAPTHTESPDRRALRLIAKAIRQYRNDNDNQYPLSLEQVLRVDRIKLRKVRRIVRDAVYLRPDGVPDDRDIIVYCRPNGDKSTRFLCAGRQVWVADVDADGNLINPWTKEIIPADR